MLELSLVRRLLRKHGKIDVAGSLMLDFYEIRILGTGSMKMLHGVEFEVEPREDHRFEVKPLGSCVMVDGSQMVVMKEDMDTLDEYMGLACESKAEILVAKGLLDEAKEHIPGIKIFKNQSGNHDEEKKSKGSCIYEVVSDDYLVVCTRLDISSVDVGVLDEFDCGIQTDVQVFVDFGCTIDHEPDELTIPPPRFIHSHSKNLFFDLMEDTWLKGLSTESGFELRLVAGITSGALVKVVLDLRFPHSLELIRIGEG
ncbi:hypothetical protein Tco_0016104 [Tanacetum coccineum]